MNECMRVIVGPAFERGDIELAGCTIGKLETGYELEHCRREECD